MPAGCYMYLYAFPVQQVILGAWPDFDRPILACMVLMVPFAVLSWHLMEAPALGWKPGAKPRTAALPEPGAAE